MEELKQTIAKIHSVHQAEIEELHTAYLREVERLRGLHSAELERKDSFYEVEKVLMIAELQASYNSKLPSLYDEEHE